MISLSTTLFSSCLNRQKSIVIINNKKYKIKKLIGEGAFSYVYLIDDDIGQEYALKLIRCQSSNDLKLIKNEINITLKFNNDFIIDVIDYEIIDDELIYILFPYYNKGSLQDKMSEGYKYDERELWELFKCICVAVQDVHNSKYVHRDIKPANFLLDDTEKPILIDFGSVIASPTFIENRSIALYHQDLASIHSTMPYRGMYFNS